MDRLAQTSDLLQIYNNIITDQEKKALSKELRST